MNCKELAELSPLYLAGELDGVHSAGFEIHLRTCATCATEIEQQKDLDALLCDGVLAEQIDTSALDVRVRQTLQAEREAKLDSHSSTSSRGNWLTIAAVIALAAIAGLGYRYRVGSAVAPVYAAVVHDHQVEVVEHAHRPWVSDSAVIQLLAAKQGVSEGSFAALAPANYHLERAKLCPLDGNTYLHLVYSDGTHELSVFLHQGDIAPLPGSERESANGRALHTASIGHDYLAGFQSDRLTALVVTDQSAPAALDAARTVASAL
jgi:Putative zinc-finger